MHLRTRHLFNTKVVFRALSVVLLGPVHALEGPVLNKRPGSFGPRMKMQLRHAGTGAESVTVEKDVGALRFLSFLIAVLGDERLK